MSIQRSSLHQAELDVSDLRSVSVTGIREMADLIGTNYYEDKHKNIFNTKKQKQEVAALVSRQLSVGECILNSIYRDKKTGAGIIVDYTLLKLFAHPACFAEISEYGISLIQQVIAEKGYYEMNINLDTMSISAMDRFRPLIETFFSAMETLDTMFADHIRLITIYNTPSFFAGLYQFVRRLISSDCSQMQLICLAKSDETKEIFYSL